MLIDVLNIDNPSPKVFQPRPTSCAVGNDHDWKLEGFSA